MTLAAVPGDADTNYRITRSYIYRNMFSSASSPGITSSRAAPGWRLPTRVTNFFQAFGDHLSRFPARRDRPPTIKKGLEVGVNPSAAVEPSACTIKSEAAVPAGATTYFLFIQRVSFLHLRIRENKRLPGPNAHASTNDSLCELTSALYTLPRADGSACIRNSALLHHRDGVRGLHRRQPCANDQRRSSASGAPTPWTAAASDLASSARSSPRRVSGSARP